MNHCYQFCDLLVAFYFSLNRDHTLCKNLNAAFFPVCRIGFQKWNCCTKEHAHFRNCQIAAKGCTKNVSKCLFSHILANMNEKQEFIVLICLSLVTNKVDHCPVHIYQTYLLRSAFTCPYHWLFSAGLLAFLKNFALHPHSPIVNILPHLLYHSLYIIIFS